MCLKSVLEYYCNKSSILKWIFIIYLRIIIVYVALYRTGLILEQVPDKFWTSSGQVSDKFGQVSF
jgi:hypothetical protein